MKGFHYILPAVLISIYIILKDSLVKAVDPVPEKTLISTCLGSIGATTQDGNYICVQNNVATLGTSTYVMADMKAPYQIKCSLKFEYCIVVGDGLETDLISVTGTPPELVKGLGGSFKTGKPNATNFLDFRRVEFFGGTNYFVIGATTADGLFRVSYSKPDVYGWMSTGSDPYPFSDLKWFSDTIYLAIGSLGHSNVTIVDLTTLTQIDNARITPSESRNLPKLFSFIEGVGDEGIFLVVSSELAVISALDLSKKSTSNVEIGQGALSLVSYPEGLTTILLTEDTIQFFSVTKVTFALVMEYTYPNDNIQGVFWSVFDDKMVTVNPNGAYTFILPGTDKCHPNCLSCTQLFTPRTVSTGTKPCTCKAGGSYSDTLGFCNLFPNLVPAGKEAPTLFTALVNETRTGVYIPPDPKPEPVESSAAVIYVIILSIALLVIIVIFGLITSKGRHTPIAIKKRKLKYRDGDKKVNSRDSYF